MSGSLAGSHAPGTDPEEAGERLAEAMGDLAPRDYGPDGVGPAASGAVAAALILAAYGAYLPATCWGSRRIVRGK